MCTSICGKQSSIIIKNRIQQQAMANWFYNRTRNDYWTCKMQLSYACWQKLHFPNVYPSALRCNACMNQIIIFLMASKSYVSPPPPYMKWTLIKGETEIAQRRLWNILLTRPTPCSSVRIEKCTHAHSIMNNEPAEKRLWIPKWSTSESSCIEPEPVLVELYDHT